MLTQWDAIAHKAAEIRFIDSVFYTPPRDNNSHWLWQHGGPIWGQGQDNTHTSQDVISDAVEAMPRPDGGCHLNTLNRCTEVSDRHAQVGLRWAQAVCWWIALSPLLYGSTQYRADFSVLVAILDSFLFRLPPADPAMGGGHGGRAAFAPKIFF